MLKSLRPCYYLEQLNFVSSLRHYKVGFAQRYDYQGIFFEKFGQPQLLTHILISNIDINVLRNKTINLHATIKKIQLESMRHNTPNTTRSKKIYSFILGYDSELVCYYSAVDWLMFYYVFFCTSHIDSAHIIPTQEDQMIQGSGSVISLLVWKSKEYWENKQFQIEEQKKVKKLPVKFKKRLKVKLEEVKNRIKIRNEQ